MTLSPASLSLHSINQGFLRLRLFNKIIKKIDKENGVLSPCQSSYLTIPFTLRHHLHHLTTHVDTDCTMKWRKLRGNSISKHHAICCISSSLSQDNTKKGKALVHSPCGKDNDFSRRLQIWCERSWQIQRCLKQDRGLPVTIFFVPL